MPQSALSVLSKDQPLFQSAKNSTEPRGGDQTTLFCLYSLSTRITKWGGGKEDKVERMDGMECRA